MHRNSIAANACAFLQALAVAQTDRPSDPTGKLQPRLLEELTKIPVSDLGRQKVAVYFVIGERFDVWSRYRDSLRRPIAERRERAIRGLRTHAARTQAELLASLRRGEAKGRVSHIAINWLGNFVSCRATADVIASSALLDSVAAVRFDAALPHTQLRDGRAAANATRGPGNGPTAVGAPRVWAMGFRGRGVVVMNADAGIHTRSNDTIIDHDALRARVWRNPGEAFNGRDDDRNGKVDDVYGWSFDQFGGSKNINDFGRHGTMTAGCMVADASCHATSYGIAPEATVMTGRLNSVTARWMALQYALVEGAHAHTSSYSWKIYSPAAPDYSMDRDVADATLLAGLIRTNSTSNDGAACSSTSAPQRPPFNISTPGCVPAPYADPAQKARGARSGVLGVGAYEFQRDRIVGYSPCGPFAWRLSELRARLPSFPHRWNSRHDDYPSTRGGLLKPDVVAATGTTTSAASGCATTTFEGTSCATPNAMGCILLWKSANASLTPEDIGMIVHQTSRDRGVPGKDNRWGAGVIDAYLGVLRALCVHRVNGDPAWSVDHKAGTGIDIALDGKESSLGVILVGAARKQIDLGFVSVGIAAPWILLTAGSTGQNGDGVRVRFAVPRSAAGVTFYSQAFVDDRRGPTQRWLTSNVIATSILP